MMMREWKLPQHTLPLGERTLVMGVVNLTPDSFSEGGGGQFTRASALRQTELMLADGADIIDIGGESTRPGAAAVSEAEELRRVEAYLPIVSQLKASVPFSVDTTKGSVARFALAAGVEIVNDISGLRFDPSIADMVRSFEAGLILMHSRGTFETMHKLEAVTDIMPEVAAGWRQSVNEAVGRGVRPEKIVLDPGIGFGKSQQQNLELIARLDELALEFSDFPLLIGTSRKSFIGRLLNDAPVDERLQGTMATVAAAVLGGARIVRVHDVRAAVETVRIIDAIKQAGARRRASFHPCR